MFVAGSMGNWLSLSSDEFRRKKSVFRVFRKPDHRSTGDTKCVGVVGTDLHPLGLLSAPKLSGILRKALSFGHLCFYSEKLFLHRKL